MKFRKLKKCIVICMLSIFIITLFCGCSSEEPRRIYTETYNDLQITYIYNDSGTVVVSKSVYNRNTKITTEYFYYYKEYGFGEELTGSRTITIDQNGKIISEFNDNINNMKDAVQ